MEKVTITDVLYGCSPNNNNNHNDNNNNNNNNIIVVFFLLLISTSFFFFRSFSVWIGWALLRYDHTLIGN